MLISALVARQDHSLAARYLKRFGIARAVDVSILQQISIGMRRG